MVHRILKTAIHPLAKFIFEHFPIPHLLAANYTKSLFKNRNSSGDDADYRADDNQLGHLSKPENSNVTADETGVPSGNGEISSSLTTPKKGIPFFRAAS